MSEIQRDIENALNKNVGLSKEAYAAEAAKADESTAAHGVEGFAPITEEERHKRIQSNFYGTALNVLINMYQLLAEIANDVKEMKENGRRKNE